MKMTKTIVAVILFASLSAPAHAGRPSVDKTTIANMKERINQLEDQLNFATHPEKYAVSCSSVNLRAAPIGFVCKTSKGKMFQRVKANAAFGEAWKGPDGLIWSDRLGKGPYRNAAEACRLAGGALPDRSALERGEFRYGFREVLPNMSFEEFWSSTETPCFYNIYYVFGIDSRGHTIHEDGYNAPFEHDNHSNSYRCVMGW